MGGVIARLSSSAGQGVPSDGICKGVDDGPYPGGAGGHDVCVSVERISVRKTIVSRVVAAELARRARIEKASGFARRVLGKHAGDIELIRSVGNLIQASKV